MTDLAVETSEQITAAAKILRSFMTKTEEKIADSTQFKDVRIRLPLDFYIEVQKIMFLRGEMTSFILLALAAIAENQKQLTIAELEMLVLARSRT